MYDKESLRLVAISFGNGYSNLFRDKAAWDSKKSDYESEEHDMGGLFGDDY